MNSCPRGSLAAACIAASILATSCSSGDGLITANALIGAELCDRGTCACTSLDTTSVVDFGSPDVGASSTRIITIFNDNQATARTLTVQRIDFESVGGQFELGTLTWRESDADDAETRVHDLSQGPLVLVDQQIATLSVSFVPTGTGLVEGTASIRSDSGLRPNWDIALRGGAGSATVCTDATTCGDGSVADFGEHQDSALGYDATAGLPNALGQQTITVTNTGETELLFNVELTNDGVPETRPGEPIGETGVFFVNAPECTILAPGESTDVVVDYRPFSAGEHTGEIVVGGMTNPIAISLIGRTVGPHICFTTEDANPNDNTLSFGEAPLFQTPSNRVETRNIIVTNCGYQEDLVVTDVTFPTNSSSNFGSGDVPWAGTVTLSPGEELLLPIDFSPSGTAGGGVMGGVEIDTNDATRPTAVALLQGTVGEAERCILISSPTIVDVGWVARDEAGVGAMPDDMISRDRSFVLTNIGLLPCTDITFGAFDFEPGSEDMFSIVGALPANFTLNPGESSAPITVRFAKDKDPDEMAETPRRAFLPYSSPDVPLSPIDILIAARSGGDPSCRFDLRPVTPPGLLCTTQSMGFGSVNLGQQRTVDLVMRNEGAEECNISSITIAGSPVFSVAPPMLPTVLNVGDQMTVPVTFAPVPASPSDPFAEVSFGCLGGIFGGVGSTELNINYTSGPSGPAQTEVVGLTGAGTRPEIDVIPGEVSLGDVTIGCCSAERRIAVHNSGNGTLTLESIAMQSGSGAGFQVSAPTSTEVQPEGSTEFTVRYCATELGDASGLIEIRSTDVDKTTFTVAVDAAGVVDSATNDVFQQPGQPLVDVLFVVDDSGSMEDEQRSLANNFDAFIGTAISLDVDYHLGVINTDADSSRAGDLYSCDGPLWVSSKQPAGAQRSQFECNVRTSRSGRPNSDARESGLEAARLALDYPKLTGFNDGFLRDNARLDIIIVTDEPDQSNGTPQLYVDYFTNLKGIGNPELMKISAISGEPGQPCLDADTNQFDYDAVQLVGGTFRNICSNDWSDLISDIGFDIFTPRRQFPLSRAATESSLMVQLCDDDGSGNPVNCQVVPANPNDGWVLDAELNSVVFNGSFIPDLGEHVLVDYVAFCFQ